MSLFLRLVVVACLVAAVSAQTIDADRDALFAAIRRGAAAGVERLFARDASPNARDAEGTPALMAAALFADADTVELLLKRGADPNLADQSGATALMWSVPDRAKIQRLLDRVHKHRMSADEILFLELLNTLSKHHSLFYRASANSLFLFGRVKDVSAQRFERAAKHYTCSETRIALQSNVRLRQGLRYSAGNSETRKRLRRTGMYSNGV